LPTRSLPADVQSDISTFFNSNIALFPRTAFADGVPTLPHFLHCYALVSSRAFQTDVYHRPALVPFADLFNHSSANHVHLETDDFVCPQCGRLAYCARHDTANPPTRLKGLDAHWQAEIENAQTDDCLLVVNRAIMEGEEVYNTYGDVGAGKSLVEYGYVDEDHEQGIEWAVEDLQESLPAENNLGHVPREWAAIIEARATEFVDLETLLYQPFDEGTGFGLSSSAQLSIPTLAIIYLANGGRDRMAFEHTVAALERLWAALEMDEEEVDLSPVFEIATAVDAFLAHKLTQLHRPDLSLSDLFAIKDVRPRSPCTVPTDNTVARA
jgi:SET domain-containing protein 6